MDLRRAGFVAMVLIGAVASSPSAAASACENTAASGQTDVTSDLRSAEKIFVRVQGFPDISSEYRVNADDTISIPVIGRVPVTGITPACLEEKLATAARAIAKRDVYLTVETVSYKPVFVTGSVSKPGSSPWFPGMTVLQAMALAGGQYRPATLVGGTFDPSKIWNLRDNRPRLQARLARLKAELAGSQTLVMPPELANNPAPEIVAIFDAEQKLLTSRLAALEANVSSVSRGQVVSKEELEALEKTRASVEEQLQIRRENREKLDELVKKGSVTQGRSMEEYLRVLELEQTSLDNSVARARVSATLAGLEQEAGNLELGRRATLESEISMIERELSMNTIDLQSAQLSLGTPVQVDGKDTLIYTIVRTEGDKSTRVPASETDFLRAGDVLVVSLAGR